MFPVAFLTHNVAPIITAIFNTLRSMFRQLWRKKNIKHVRRINKHKKYALGTYHSRLYRFHSTRILDPLMHNLSVSLSFSLCNRDVSCFFFLAPFSLSQSVRRVSPKSPRNIAGNEGQWKSKENGWNIKFLYCSIMQFLVSRWINLLAYFI